MTPDVEIQFQLVDRIALWPELEASPITAREMEGSYVADILPKLRNRINKGSLVSRFHQSPDQSHFVGDGFAVFPSPYRVNPVLDESGKNIGFVGLDLGMYDDLVVDPADPAWTVRLYFLDKGEKFYYPEAQYSSKTGLYKEPRTFSRSDIEFDVWRLRFHKDNEGPVGIFAEFTPPAPISDQ